MPLPAWPALVPTPKLPVASEPAEVLVRTDMESGAARSRRRYTARVTTHGPLVVGMSRSEFAVFEAWYHYKLHDGADWFALNWPGNQGVASHEMRFPQRYTYRLVAEDAFEVSFTLETRTRALMSEAALDALLNP